MNTLNETLKNQAVTKGLCKKWQRDWNENWPKQKLIDKFYEGIDFCIKNQFPPCSFIRKNFTDRLLRENGVYADDNWSGLNHRKCAIMGASDIILRYNAIHTGRIYITGDRAKLNITTSNLSFVIIHAFGEPCVNIEQKDTSRVILILHDKGVKYNIRGKVTVTEEFDYLK